MSAHKPPIPPEQQAPHAGSHSEADPAVPTPSRRRGTNTAEQGIQGNIRENTTNTGYQQDR